MIEPTRLNLDPQASVSLFDAPSFASVTETARRVLSPTGMFSISVRNDPAGRVVIMGKSTRKRAKTLLNVPICQATRRRLDEQFVGSLLMATSALIEWALDELRRQGVTLEVQPQ